jgi:hypothetical protein
MKNEKQPGEQQPDNQAAERGFRTLRGALVGDEPDEENYFAYSASLRIFGDQLDFAEIQQHLGLTPTTLYRKGDRRGPRSPGYKQDMWSYKPDVPEERALAEHITALWRDIKHAEEYLRWLKQIAAVDVFLGYRSNVDHAGVEVPHTCLEMFTALEIPFGLSIIIT